VCFNIQAIFFAAASRGDSGGEEVAMLPCNQKKKKAMRGELEEKQKLLGLDDWMAVPLIILIGSYGYTPSIHSSDAEATVLYFGGLRAEKSRKG
jgi:hypothetical protein